MTSMGGMDMAQAQPGGMAPEDQSLFEAPQLGEASARNGGVASSNVEAEDDDIDGTIAAMLAEDVTTEVVHDETTATEQAPLVELTASEVVARMKESRPDFKVNVKKLCHHLETSGRPYAGRKAHALRERVAEIGKLSRRLGAKERKRKRGPQEKVPERPDYFAIAVRIQELGSLADAPGSPVTEIQQNVDDEEFVMPATPQADAVVGGEESDFDEPPTKKRKQRKHMNAQQQADALSKLEAKIKEINSAAGQPQQQNVSFQPGWTPLSPPKNASNQCSPEKKELASRYMHGNDVDGSLLAEISETGSSGLQAPDLKTEGLSHRDEAETPETAALQAQDIAVVSRLALAAKYLSAVQSVEYSVTQELRSFGFTFCGRKCWDDRCAYYEDGGLAESDEDKVAWAKAILIGLIETVELFDDAAADAIDRFVQLI